MDISKLQLPAWLLPTLNDIMTVAESTFGPRTGQTKKAWVRQALLTAARMIDVPLIPAWIEDPAKEAIIDFLVEVVWSLHFAPFGQNRRIVAPSA